MPEEASGALSVGIVGLTAGTVGRACVLAFDDTLTAGLVTVSCSAASDFGASTGRVFELECFADVDLRRAGAAAGVTDLSEVVLRLLDIGIFYPIFPPGVRYSSMKGLNPSHQIFLGSRLGGMLPCR